MREYGNIEKSGFYKSEYTGYANGAWRIRKNGTNRWRATKSGEAPIDARSLAEMSAKLEKKAAG